MNNKLFRESSLEKLSSPDKLDQLIRITNSKSWLSIISLFVLIITIIIWSILFNINVNIEASGIIISHEKSLNIKTKIEGIVGNFRVQEGDRIDEGDVICNISSPYTLQKLKKEEAKLNDLKKSYKHLQSYYAKDICNKKLLYEKKDKINSLKLEEIKFNYKDKEELEIEKKIIKKRMLDSKINFIKIKHLYKRKLLLLSKNISKSSKNLMKLKDKFDLETNIRSPISGRIKEISVVKGELLNHKKVICKLELRKDKNEEFIIFVSDKEINKIKKGIDIRIASSKFKNINYITGTIKEISRYPINPAYIQQKFINGDKFIIEGYYFEVVVDNLSLNKIELKDKLSKNSLFYCSITLNKINAISFIGLNFNSKVGGR